MICENITIGANGHLHFAGQDTVALAKQYGTPLYLLDEDYIRISAVCIRMLSRSISAPPAALCMPVRPTPSSASTRS